MTNKTKCNALIKFGQDGMDWTSCELPKGHKGDHWSDALL